MLDFALVLAVIFMSATVSVAQARGLVKASRLQSAFSRDRRLLGLRINSYVFSYRAVTGASVPNDIQKTVESLRLAMRESQTNIEGLRKSTESLAKAIPTINEKSLELAKSSEVLGKSLEVVLGQTAKSVERILSDIDGTGTAIKTSARAVQDQIQSLQREISRKK
jgi:methyl-accepting chemotaxis protein